MKIALGPLLYYWPREQVLEFYRSAAEWPLDIVYLGETVCAKRRAVSPEDWMNLGRMLAAAGKQVVISTLALVESEAELAGIKRCCDNGEFLVEANDQAAVQMMHARGLPFVAGPSINIYNHRSYDMLRREGMSRWVMPVELGRESLLAMHGALVEEGRVECEVFAYGRLPLAYSARCFTARAHDLPKDSCGFVCLEYPGGLPVRTREGKSFLTLNGIQTQSARLCNLSGDGVDLERSGVDIVRISPQAAHTGEVVCAFRRLLDGEGAGCTAIESWMDGEACSGYWHGRAGME